MGGGCEEGDAEEIGVEKINLVALRRLRFFFVLILAVLGHVWFAFSRVLKIPIVPRIDMENEMM